jgi:VWFA-related protein
MSLPLDGGLTVTTALTRRLAFTLVLFALSIGLVAQQPGGAQSTQTPVPQAPSLSLTANVDLVLVDVNAVDAADHPIEGLRAEDFTVSVDGKPRKVASADYVGYPLPASARKEAAAPAEPSMPASEFSSNRMPGRSPDRLVLILVDENNILAGSAIPLMRGASRFLDQLLPTDRVGLYALPAGVRVEVTTNHRAIKDALMKIAGRRPARRGMLNISPAEGYEITNGNQRVEAGVVSRECLSMLPGTSGSDSEQQQREACRRDVVSEARQVSDETMNSARTTLQVLRELARRLRDIQGPKTIVLVSEALPLDNRGELLGEISAAASDAAAGRVTIYGIQAASPAIIDISSTPTSAPSILSSAEERGFLTGGFSALVTAAGGVTLSATGQGDGAFSKVALEVSGYYLLGLEPTPDDRDGKSHRIDVKVARPGAQVRARREFTISASGGHRGDESDEVALTRTLQSPYQATDFPLSLAAYPVRDARGDRVRLLLGADIDADATDARDYAIAVTVRDRQGNVINTFLQRERLRPRAPLGPFGYSASVPVDPGDYVVRLAVRDRSGRLASVDHPVSARFVPVGRYDSGTLVLADEDASAAGKWHPSVDGTVRSPQLAAYFELHAGDRALLPTAHASLEVAESEQSAALLSVPLALETSAEDKRVAFGRLDVGLLPPGQYTARVVVGAGGHEPARLLRRFAVQPSASLFAASGTQARTRVVPFADATRPFELGPLLQPATISPFLDRLSAGGQQVPATVRPALDLAREGKLAAIAGKLAPAAQLFQVPFLRGLSLLATHDLERAAGEFRATLRAKDDFFPAAFYLAACYAAGGREKEAAAGFGIAIAGESDMRPAYVQAIGSTARLGDWDRTRDLVSEATAQWPADAWMARMAMSADVMTGHDTEAFARVSRYLEASGGDGEALFLALRLLAQGKDRPGREPGTADRDAFERLASVYQATHGPNLALVELWRRRLTAR